MTSSKSHPTADLDDDDDHFPASPSGHSQPLSIIQASTTTAAISEEKAAARRKLSTKRKRKDGEDDPEQVASEIETEEGPSKRAKGRAPSASAMRSTQGQITYFLLSYLADFARLFTGSSAVSKKPHSASRPARSPKSKAPAEDEDNEHDLSNTVDPAPMRTNGSGKPSTSRSPVKSKRLCRGFLSIAATSRSHQEKVGLIFGVIQRCCSSLGSLKDPKDPKDVA
jgi:hypothetical protein